jgi:TP901 family phage tail tape measure protein
MGIGGSMGSIGGVSYDILINDETKAGADSAIENFQRIDEQSVLTVSNLAKIAAAFAALTAISSTAVTASDRVVSLERETAHAAVTQGVSTRAMYEYVQSLSNADDTQDEVAATMSYLTRTGLRMSDDLGSVYETMDLIGDATKTTSTAIAQELIPAFHSLGLKSQDIAKYADLLTYATQYSLFEISDWAMLIRRNGESLMEFHVPLEDTIAIMARLAELGVPQRKVLTIMNEAFKEMGASAKIAAEGEEELVKIQEKLNELQETGSKTTKRYLEDILDAGNDMGKIRQLTKEHNRQVEDDANEKKKLLKEQADLQAKVDAAKSAPTPTLPAALAKVLPELVTEKDLTDFIAKAKTESVGKAGEYAPAGEIVTGTEIAKYNMDQLMQNTIGKGIDANTAASMVHLRDISGAMTAAVSALAIIQGLSAVTAASTSATAIASGATTGTSMLSGMNALLGGTSLAGIGAAGALSVGAGLGVGALGVYGLEKAGLLGLTGKGAVRSAGGTFMDILTGDVGNAYLAEYLRTHNGQYPPGYNPKASNMEEYDEGGLVPGAQGQPQLAIVHGGETVVPAGRSGDLIINLNGTEILRVPNVISGLSKAERIQKGIRTAQ